MPPSQLESSGRGIGASGPIFLFRPRVHIPLTNQNLCYIIIYPITEQEAVARTLQKSVIVCHTLASEISQRITSVALSWKPQQTSDIFEHVVP